jgi:hypothetical protein
MIRLNILYGVTFSQIKHEDPHTLSLPLMLSTELEELTKGLRGVIKKLQAATPSLNPSKTRKCKEREDKVTRSLQARVHEVRSISLTF